MQLQMAGLSRVIYRVITERGDVSIHVGKQLTQVLHETAALHSQQGKH